MKPKDKVRKRIFEIIQIGNDTDIPSRLFDIVIVAVIIICIIAMYLETFESLSSLKTLFNVIEIASSIIFCIEYILRVITADFLFKGLGRGKAAFRFIISFDGIVELFTILPFFYLSGFVVFRMLRVVRILHLFRINNNYDSFNVIITVIREKKNQIMSSIFIVLVLLLASSLCMYSIEHEAQPEVFKNAFSGIWWSMSTLLTIGYGDIYPVTLLGRVIAMGIELLGVCVVAIPTGIISAGFVEQYTKFQNGIMDGAVSTNSVVLRTISIEMDSAWTDMSIEEIKKEFNVVIVRVTHKEMTFVPADDYRLALHDVIIAAE